MTGRRLPLDANNETRETPLPSPEQVEQALSLFDRLRHRAAPGDGDRLFGVDVSTPFARQDETDVNSAAVKATTETPDRIGRFQIIRRLGEGGFGVVFLAKDPELNRLVALKVPGPGVLMQKELLGRFLREGEAAAALDHPQIVPIYEAGRVGAVYFIASAFISGMPLSDWLANHGKPLDPRSAARLVALLADAVQHAHSRGILHRDLKPSNVLLEQSTTNAPSELEPSCLAEAARLTDFGLAKLLAAESEEGETRSEAILGTPAYMSPEQAEARNRDVGTPADIYALGAILYELLTGEPPFKRGSHVATLTAVCTEDATPPSRRVSGIPLDVEAICLKCLEKPIEARYPAASALLEDLQRFLSGYAVVARPIGRKERFRRWIKRNPGIAVLSGTAIVLSLALLIGTTTAVVLLNAAHRRTQDHLAAETEAKTEAKLNENFALRALYDSRVAQARAQRSSGLVGQRHESLMALLAAAKSMDRLGLGEEERFELRNEAIAAMVLPDLVPEQNWDVEWRSGLWFATDADVEYYAWNSDNDTILIHRFEDNAVVQRLLASGQVPGRRGFVRGIRFSPDGRWLAAHYWRGNSYAVLVWDISRNENQEAVSTDERQPVFAVDAADRNTQPVDFSSDGESLAVVRRSGDVDLIATQDFEVIATLPSTSPAQIVRFNSTTTRLAISRMGRIDIVDLATNETLRTIAPPDVISDLDWCPNKNRLAGACHDQHAYVWNTETGVVETDLSGHAGRVRRVSFHPGGQLIATWADDTMTRIWDVQSGRQVLVANTELTNFSADGMRLGAATARFKFLNPDAVRVADIHAAVDGRMSSVDLLSCDAAGRVLFVSNAYECVCVDLLTANILETARVDYGWMKFDATGTSAVGVSSRFGLARLPVHRNTRDRETTLVVGPPEPLAATAPIGFLSVSKDGAFGASAEWRRGNRVQLFDVHRGTSRSVTHPRARYLDMTPDGRMLATGTWQGKGVKVWDTRDGSLIKALPAGNASVQFNPDATQLAVDEGRLLTVWDVGDWQPVLKREAKSDSAAPKPVAYSSDGRFLAVLESRRVIRILDGESFDELARFTLPEHCYIQALCFTPDGARLVAGTFHPGSVHIWDLARIRGNLRKMGLDWTDEALPEDLEKPTDPIRVTLDLVAPHGP